MTHDKGSWSNRIFSWYPELKIHRAVFTLRFYQGLYWLKCFRILFLYKVIKLSEMWVLLDFEWSTFLLWAWYYQRSKLRLYFDIVPYQSYPLASEQRQPLPDSLRRHGRDGLQRAWWNHQNQGAASLPAQWCAHVCHTQYPVRVTANPDLFIISPVNYTFCCPWVQYPIISLPFYNFRH